MEIKIAKFPFVGFSTRSVGNCGVGNYSLCCSLEIILIVSLTTQLVQLMSVTFSLYNSHHTKITECKSCWNQRLMKSRRNSLHYCILKFIVHGRILPISPELERFHQFGYYDVLKPFSFVYCYIHLVALEREKGEGTTKVWNILWHLSLHPL